MDIDSSNLPPPPPPPPEITEELQAQLAELTRQAMEQLQALLESLRQAEEQLPKAPEEPPVTGGLDPLPSGEDGTVVDIKSPDGPPEFVIDPGPPQLSGFWGETSEAAPRDGLELGASKDLSALSRLDAMPVEQVAADLSVVADDLVPVAAPAAIEEWIAAPSAPAAAATSVAEEPAFQAFATHEFRAGAEGQAA